ncbi:hypothetical protein E4U21_003824 [Claviceps maximensis]|nr:hypothetical protein E4U21_003824 [Claviceps maximensis]
MSSPALVSCAQVYATMLLSDSYLPGALVLGHSLRDAGAKRKVAVLVTLDTVSASSISQLKAVYDYIIPVPRIRNEHPANLSLMDRPDLHSAFTKINLWKQIQFSKIVYLDADVIAYRAPDELFDLPHAFSAAPDVGWPDIFNTGVMVLTPDMGDYYAMLAMAERGLSFDGADQGLINMHFRHSTNRLSFTYNVTPSAHYQYIPAYLHFQSSISLVHFIGPNKPWSSSRSSTHGNGPVDQMLGRWWAVHDRHFRAQTSVSAIEQRHDHHGPNRSTTPITYTATDLQNPAHAQFVEHQIPQQKPPHSPPPLNSWDAQRQPPPPNSKPEAVDFPTAYYEMSRDTSQFVPPVRYPSPPKNMWYEVPKQAPVSVGKGKPRQVFPWEAKQPAPSRSFVGSGTHEPNLVSSAAEASMPSEDLAQGSSHTRSSSGPAPPLSSSGTRILQEGNSGSAPAITGDPWNSFSRTNAWDDIPGIGRYVENFHKHTRTDNRSNINTPEFAISRSASAATLEMPRALRVTDFPTEVERPSLPVTPAPIKRPSFRSEERNYHGAGDQTHSLPAAEGVPSQSDWDPAAQLQMLAQQQSEALLRRLSEDRRLSKNGPSRPLPSGPETLQFPSYVVQALPSSRLSTPQPVPGKTAASRSAESSATAHIPTSKIHTRVDDVGTAEH